MIETIVGGLVAGTAIGTILNKREEAKKQKEALFKELDKRYVLREDDDEDEEEPSRSEEILRERLKNRKHDYS